MDTKLAKKLENIQTDFRKSSAMIKHSTPLTFYAGGPQLDLRDLILTGALSGRNVLLNGGTGTAKTHTSLLALNSLFGANGYGQIQVDPGLNEEKLFNIFFGAIQDGKDLAALFDGNTLAITSPGVLIDETNRAPPEILNFLQAYLNNQTLTPGGGKNVPIGHELKNGERYQFKLGTCNEGKAYEGSTWRMDPAFRRRWAIEIPVNLFAPTEDDYQKMIQECDHIGVPVPTENKGHLTDILDLHEGLRTLPIHPTAQEFLLYLGRMNNCTESPYKTKDEEGFSIKRCKGCHARGLAEEQNFCANAFAPANATITDIKMIARAFAILRAYRILGNKNDYANFLKEHKEKEQSEYSWDNLEVMPADLYQAFPFVAATKVGFDQAWLMKYFKSGETHQAAKTLALNLEKRIRQKTVKLGELMVKSEYSDDDVDILKKYGKDDPWAVGLRDCDYRAKRL
jgi:MoxR-like ATPase